MRDKPSAELEKCRLLDDPKWLLSPTGVLWGLFRIPVRPTWEEMCAIKNMFWGEDETVIQFHPQKTDYVNEHPYCLHLWKHVSGHPLPPKEYV